MSADHCDHEDTWHIGHMPTLVKDGVVPRSEWANWKRETK